MSRLQSSISNRSTNRGNRNGRYERIWKQPLRRLWKIQSHHVVYDNYVAIEIIIFFDTEMTHLLRSFYIRVLPKV